MVSFFDFSSMSLNKQKIITSLIIKWLKKMSSLAILLAFVASIAIPATINTRTRRIGFNFKEELANNSQKTELVFKESRGIRAKLANNSQKKAPSTIVRAVITAYTSTPDQTDDSPFITASGKRVYDGMIAANWLPFGTQIKIPTIYGDKVFTVDDRMNPRYGHGRMDIWLDAPRDEAIKFGVRVAEVEVYYQTYRLSKR